MDDELNQLKKKKDYFQQFLTRFEQSEDIIPFVQMNLEMTDWQINALLNSPDEASEIPRKGIFINVEREVNNLPSTLPMIPSFDLQFIISSTATTTTGTSDVYEYVSRVGDIGTPNSIAYSEKYTQQYHDLQEKQNRINNVRDLIVKLGNPKTLRRFDVAVKAYSLQKVKEEEKTSAALKIRTLLDGIQGDLFSMARKWPKENMTWDEMARRLIKDENQQQNHHALINQGFVRSTLISRLSTIAKDREGGALTNLDYVWTQVLDFIYSTLILVRK